MRLGLWIRLTKPDQRKAFRLAQAVHGPVVDTYEGIRPYIAAPDEKETNPALQVRLETVGLFLHWLNRYAQAHDRAHVFNASIDDALPHLAHSIAEVPTPEQFPIFFAYFVERMNASEQAYCDVAEERPGNQLFGAVANAFHMRIARFLANDLLNPDLDLTRYNAIHEVVVRSALTQMFKTNFDRYI